MIALRGYAVPFGLLTQVPVDGYEEFVEPGAFHAMLRGQHRVFINFADHGAPGISSSVRLFTDDYGLGFEASIPEIAFAGIAYERAAVVTRDSIWTRAYILRLDPAEAAKLAAREYDSTHRRHGSRGRDDRLQRRRAQSCGPG